MNTHPVLSITILLLALWAGWVGAAVDEAVSPADPADRITRLVEKLQEEGEARNPAGLPMMPKEVTFSPATMDSMQQSIKAYYDYKAKGFAHRRAVFEWQLFSSKIIFAIVVFLVGVGIYFSWIQFSASMGSKTKRPQSERADDKERIAPMTTLEASAEGIKVSSPVLGVILLVISLAFFYLYLVYVYPIAEIF